MCFASRRSMQCSDGQQLMRKLRFPKATAVPIGEFIEVFLEFGDTVKRAEKTSFEIRDGGGHMHLGEPLIHGMRWRGAPNIHIMAIG